MSLFRDNPEAFGDAEERGVYRWFCDLYAHTYGTIMPSDFKTLEGLVSALRTQTDEPWEKVVDACNIATGHHAIAVEVGEALWGMVGDENIYMGVSGGKRQD